MDDETLISVKNIFILAFILVISFAVISILLRNDSIALAFLGDITSVVIDLLVVLTLFYATIRSAHLGLRVQIAWMIMTVAFMVYAIGDILWAILELGLQQNPFPSVADVFYLTFYPLFALGIYYLARFSFTRSEKLKIFIDMGTVIITVGLIFWTFLIIPTLSSPENLFTTNVSAIYIIGDFLLLLVLLRLLYSKVDENYGSVLFLGMGILVLICTDTIFAFQTLQGTYVSGGLLDTGWILSFVLVGLAAFLQASEEKFDFQRFSQIRVWFQRSNLTPYLPLIWVLIAFTLLIWANDNVITPNLEYIELGVGFIIVLVIIRQVITLNENKNLITAAGKELNYKNKVERVLVESEKRLFDIIDFLPDATFAINSQGKVIAWNRAIEDLTGFKAKDIMGKGNYEYSLPFYGMRRPILIDLVTHSDENIEKHYDSFERNGEVILVETEAPLKGINRTLWGKAVPLYDGNGHINGAIEAIRDITERKNAENEIKSSLKEKNILLQEIHHRVKNNMQIISSLLSLQTKYVDEEEAVNVLKESQNRVKSMAMIHEKLYISKDLAHINFVDYIQSLVKNLFYSYNIENTNIKPIFDVEDITLNMETAVPCGLIMSELVSNSLKYAFPNGMKGEILVSLKTVDDKYELIIRDNGIGLQEDIDFNNLETLGLLLVNNLIEQIDGELTINRSSGTEFKIKFKELEYKERI
ncbi:histidine kinase dimerization/phosphoacceptor domain -containing protein [Methanobacterium spitsbergense]|uniref:PAS domain S-box protein n=1 Tax=Methanobacterium spitsbergense TaxID=2874285 RepID=A0A8T5UP47_9EURY|nr:histidine kinase dimerization/phosphoacceptor domain -containing protein [Methanobacterium spitsbergense]MBZ2165414.1 PAS domain S-box protein [Methanobacterium spitsbergense]